MLGEPAGAVMPERRDADEEHGVVAHHAAALLLVDQRPRTLDDPHVVARVHGDPGDLPEDPVVGQGLGPGGVDLETARGLTRRRLRAAEERENCRY